MGKLIRADFSKRGKDLYYMQKDELQADRVVKKLIRRNARAMERNNAKMMNL